MKKAGLTRLLLDGKRAPITSTMGLMEGSLDVSVRAPVTALVIHLLIDCRESGAIDMV